jgi:alpha-beta hydrolase superfamily lysophospholipase
MRRIRVFAGNPAALPGVTRFVPRRYFRSLLAFVVVTAAAAGGCASLDQWQRSAIFSPVQGEQRWHREPLAGTEEFDLPVQDQRVRAWFTPSGRAGAPTVLYLHGARWNLNGSVFRIERWVDMGFDVLAIDYRGFGRSSQIVPSEESVYRDAHAAFEELERRQPDPGRRVLYGHSLGGAVALELAADGLGPRIGAVVVESTFTSIPALVRGMRWGWLPGLDYAITQRFDSISKLARVENPLLVIHGTGDRLVPDSMADELHAAAGSRVKRVVKLDGATHSGASRHPEYADAVRAFMHLAEIATVALDAPQVAHAGH